MKYRVINYLILSMALCLGQLVTHAHIIGHFELASTPHDHAGHHGGTHNHSTQIVDFRSKPTSDKSADSILAECGIYHVFFGMHGIAVSYGSGLSEHSTCEVGAKLPVQLVVTQTSDWHLIRGPPTNS